MARAVFVPGWDTGPHDGEPFLNARFDLESSLSKPGCSLLLTLAALTPDGHNPFVGIVHLVRIKSGEVLGRVAGLA